MSEANYTKRKWIVTGSGAERDVVCESGFDEPYYIAQVYDGADNATALDNANLIAQAPAMYEENERQLAFLTNIIQRFPVNSQEALIISERIDAIVLIQAKARDEE